MKKIAPKPPVLCTAKEVVAFLTRQAPKVARPSFVREGHLLYLDALRESGRTNMYAATPYVQHRFKVSENRAGDILDYWIKTFAMRHRTSTDVPFADSASQVRYSVASTQR